MQDVGCRVGCLSLLGLLIASAVAEAQPGQLVRVPQDAKTLTDAVSQVRDGGVIQIAAGTYASPNNGFSITGANARKSFTVRAVQGATVVLDGGGSRPILRFLGAANNRGKLIVFERLTFRNGKSTTNNTAGGATVQAADARFVDCVFEGNETMAPATGAGAVKLFDGAVATFSNCDFRDNHDPLRGGALVVRDSTATVQGGSFVGNSTNRQGHRLNAAGGAIAVLNGTLRVVSTRFEGNEAGWTGGAIFAIGVFGNPRGSQVTVIGSTFADNQAEGHPCCVNPVPTSGGALHAEDLTSMSVHGSLFVRNRADTGGAIDNYRGLLEVHGSAFSGNQSTRSKPLGSAGGAIALFSVDFNDNSTNGGTVNRRSGSLVVSRSLFRGGDEVESDPVAGGCLFTAGDANRQFGEGGVPALGTAEENRAKVRIEQSVFVDCDVATSPTADGFGGAILGNFVDLQLVDSIIVNSDARGEGAGGGGVALRQESTATILRSAFAGNSGARWGGAVWARGSHLEVRDSRFIRNEVSPGESEPVNVSRGAAILTIPFTSATRPKESTGLVASSLFSEQLGVPIFEVDPVDGPSNAMRYENNRFNPTIFGDVVFVNPRLDANGSSANQLNALKGGGNSRVFSPREGALLAVPSFGAVGAEAASPLESALAFAWTGSSATLSGAPLAARGGFVEVGPGLQTLAVGGTQVATQSLSGTCTAGPFLCLNGNRFVGEVAFEVGATAGTGQATALTNDTGFYWFFNPANVELMVKVLDGRALNNHFWVFFGALTATEYSLTLADRATGAVKTYRNREGTVASVADTTAFRALTSPALLSQPTPQHPPGEEGESRKTLRMRPPSPGGRGGDGRRGQGMRWAGALSGGGEGPGGEGQGGGKACSAGATALCLTGSRIRVELSWKDGSGNGGPGQAVTLTGDTGYFWFFSPDNVEVILKVLDGRGINGHFWVFFGALSNLEYTITVTDTETGATRTYTNPQGNLGSRADTQALPAG